MFSDQQLVTGLAILIAGFSQISSGISTVYWQVIVDLAWFSSITHVATLAALRPYFRKHRSTRIWRVVLMISLALLQIAALVPTGNNAWPTTWGPQNIPVRCFCANLGDVKNLTTGVLHSSTTPGMAISIIYIVIS